MFVYLKKEKVYEEGVLHLLEVFMRPILKYYL